jgi:hypothetical protein
VSASSYHIKGQLVVDALQKIINMSTVS